MRDKIVSFIAPHTRILDLGCGQGELLEILRDQKKCQCYGIDIDYRNILACTERGISAFQGDLDEGLTEFADQSYDVVVLSQTLQQVHRPLLVIEEMLRVGKMAVVTFPNFAYWKVRRQLLLGYIPKNEALPYSWYDTPNIRVISINAFRQLCQDKDIEIVQENHESDLPFLDNLLASRGIFLIQKKSYQ